MIIFFSRSRLKRVSVIRPGKVRGGNLVQLEKLSLWSLCGVGCGAKVTIDRPFSKARSGQNRWTKRIAQWRP